MHHPEERIITKGSERTRRLDRTTQSCRVKPPHACLLNTKYSDRKIEENPLAQRRIEDLDSRMPGRCLNQQSPAIGYSPLHADHSRLKPNTVTSMRKDRCENWRIDVVVTSSRPSVLS